MVHLVQFLARAAEVPTQLNESHDAAAVTHHFVTVADRIVSHENAPAWHAITQVTAQNTPATAQKFVHSLAEKHVKFFHQRAVNAKDYVVMKNLYGSTYTIFPSYKKRESLRNNKKDI